MRPTITKFAATLVFTFATILHDTRTVKAVENCYVLYLNCTSSSSNGTYSEFPDYINWIGCCTWASPPDEQGTVTYSYQCEYCTY